MHGSKENHNKSQPRPSLVVLIVYEETKRLITFGVEYKIINYLIIIQLEYSLSAGNPN